MHQVYCKNKADGAEPISYLLNYAEIYGNDYNYWDNFQVAESTCCFSFIFDHW